MASAPNSASARARTGTVSPNNAPRLLRAPVPRDQLARTAKVGAPRNLSCTVNPRPTSNGYVNRVRVSFQDNERGNYLPSNRYRGPR